MEIKSKAEATPHANTSACTAYEYGMPTDVIDSAVIELNGRYPEEGWVLNTACTSLVHVIKGTGSLLSPEGEYPLEEDTQVQISPNEKYAFEGKMKLLFSASPRWSPGQSRSAE